MNRFVYPLVWLSRIHRCLGFGIQSPTDYQFVREVINEHSPYYAYENLGAGDGWLRRRLGLLYFRLANWRQPAVILDRVGVETYLLAGCRKATIKNTLEPDADMAIVSDVSEAEWLLPHCNDRSVVVIEGIKKNNSRWDELFLNKKVTIAYDLYYCGILLFDSKRSKQSYVVNF